MFGPNPVCFDLAAGFTAAGISARESFSTRVNTAPHTKFCFFQSGLRSPSNHCVFSKHACQGTSSTPVGKESPDNKAQQANGTYQIPKQLQIKSGN
jgi:hypothetical protein